MPTQGAFDVEISLAKGIIFRKIGLANGAILKLWAAHPCQKFSREPPRGNELFTKMRCVLLANPKRFYGNSITERDASW